MNCVLSMTFYKDVDNETMQRKYPLKTHVSYRGNVRFLLSRNERKETFSFSKDNSRKFSFFCMIFLKNFVIS